MQWVLQRRGAEHRDRQLGAQVQDRPGQLAGSRGAGEEGQEEYDARGIAEGAATGNTEGGGTIVTRERRYRTTMQRIYEDMGQLEPD